MNELNGQPRRPSRRRWIYLGLAAVVLIFLLLIPKFHTANFALQVAPGNNVRMLLKVPPTCAVTAFYLRGSDKVPKQGKLFTLVVNGKKCEIKDWEKLRFSSVPDEGNTQNRIPDFELPADLTQKEALWEVSCIEVSKDLPVNALEVNLELKGPQEDLKDWSKFIKLISE